MTKYTLSPIKEIIREAKKGKMFILVDDEDRENEGDIIAPAACITPELINIMKDAGGLICVAINHEVYERFALEMHPRRNIEASETAFTFSVDAVSGIDNALQALNLKDPFSNEPYDYIHSSYTH